MNDTKLIENSFDEMLGLHQGSDSNFIQAQRTCILMIIFSFLVLIVSLLYAAVPDRIHCEDANPEDNVPQILSDDPNSNLAVERYVKVVSVDEIVDDNNHNFFPDVNDIQVLDDSYFFYDPQQLVQQQEKFKDSFRNGDAVDREALTAVKKALQLKQKNNFEKARRLFQHAIALSPRHHDVLLHYGEFLESDEDFINADHFYVKALMLRPKDSRALANRKRTLPVVNQLDLKELKRIDAKRGILVRINKKDPTLKRLKKEIYFQHIYHTVAIEGNTMNLDETRSIVETRVAVAGKSILEHGEILGVESALRYVNQTLANENSVITVKHILEIHRRVMGYVDPLTAGTFRKSQVFVGNHIPPPASEVEALMDEYVAMINSHDVRKMHPIHIAALVHYKLVFIHPFLDGNGRTARVLMNLIFVRHNFPPIIIRKEDRNQYFQLLRASNEGDLRPFYRFIAQAAEYTIDAFLQAHGINNPQVKAIESTSDSKDIIPLGR